MARLKITRTCKTCGNDFIGWTGNAALYCSSNCYHQNRDAAIDRFLRKIDKSSGYGPWGDCWLWMGKRTDRNYGKSGLGPAHRVYWELNNGPILDGLFVLHRCDNPPCVRIDHLFLGTNADNMADMVSKDRSPWGDRHPNAILTAEIVLQARALYVPRKFGYQKIADLLGVREPAIRAAVTGVTWKHL